MSQKKDEVPNPFSPGDYVVYRVTGEVYVVDKCLKDILVMRSADGRIVSDRFSHYDIYDPQRESR